MRTDRYHGRLRSAPRVGRWIPAMLGLGAFSLGWISSLDPLTNALVVGAYLLYCTIMTVEFVLPELEQIINEA